MRAGQADMALEILADAQSDVPRMAEGHSFWPAGELSFPLVPKLL